MDYSNRKKEYGDFQTPLSLATEICNFLKQQGLKPASIIEPTCGKGNFLTASISAFEDVCEVIGLDINSDYIENLREDLSNITNKRNIKLFNEDFFLFGWADTIKRLPNPILVIGNPPWITNSHLSTFGSSNRPQKYNFLNIKGLDAITGASNFDISENMLMQLIEILNGRKAVLAMIVKYSTSRKLYCFCRNKSLMLSDYRFYYLDSRNHFGVSVDAGLLYIEFYPPRKEYFYEVYESFYQSKIPLKSIGTEDGVLVSEIKSYHKLKHLIATDSYNWRSGIKHDCSKVMELYKNDAGFKNSLGEIVELEDDFLYPMLKSSDIDKDKPVYKYMLVPQKRLGESTSYIKDKAPKTWNYLCEHKGLLDKRASNIYKKQPAFSVFGVGDYTFLPWKVAVSGFYKSLKFKAVGPYESKPVVFDDTVYFLPLSSGELAQLIARALNTDVAREFFKCFLFGDEKRPITAKLLKRLDILALIRSLGWQNELNAILDKESKDSLRFWLHPKIKHLSILDY